MNKFLVPFFLVFFTFGCAQFEPQNNSERLAAAEVSYQVALNTIQNLADSGKIEPGSTHANNVARYITIVRSALDQWHVFPESDDKMQIALSALTALNEFLEVFEDGSNV